MSWWRTNELRALSGDCALQVAARIGRTPVAVQCKARRVGVPAPRMPNRRYWPESTRQRALTLRKKGLPVSRISKATGVPFGTVRRWVYGAAA